MLTPSLSDQPARRRPRSLRQEYDEFILQRIEEYKEHLSRDELLKLADEAVRELDVGAEGQLVLTEVLVLDYVDRLIKKRLHLPSFRRWREKHHRVRQAQRNPTHWGLPGDFPIDRLAGLTGDDDVALVIGARSMHAALLLAAHDVNVLIIDRDLSAIEAAESRAASEALSSRFQGLVVQLGSWFPDVHPAVSVIDPHLAQGLDDTTRARLFQTLRDQTPIGGVHVIARRTIDEKLPTRDMWKKWYAEWRTEVPTKGSKAWRLAWKK